MSKIHTTYYHIDDVYLGNAYLDGKVEEILFSLFDVLSENVGGGKIDRNFYIKEKGIKGLVLYTVWLNRKQFTNGSYQKQIYEISGPIKCNEILNSIVENLEGDSYHENGPYIQLFHMLQKVIIMNRHIEKQLPNPDKKATLNEFYNIIKMIERKNIIPTVLLFNSILVSLKYVEGIKFDLLRHIKKLFLNKLFGNIIPNKKTFEILGEYVNEGYIQEKDIRNIKNIYKINLTEPIRITLSELKTKLIEIYLANNNKGGRY